MGTLPLLYISLPAAPSLAIQCKTLARRYAKSEGASGFASQQLAQQLRAAAFSGYGVRLPARGQLPKTITIFQAAEGEEVCRAPRTVIIAREATRSLGP